MKKNVFVILGMARSGTSVITRGVKALGIDLGEKLTPSSKWNPKGFWEDNEIVYKINEGLLAELNSAWDSVNVIDDASQDKESLRGFKNQAIAIINKRFETTDYWGFKDPRSVKLLHFWQQVFAEANVIDHYIIALRNPLSAAQSYQRLTGADIEHGLLLWLTHILTAVEKTQGKKRVIVSYDLMMQNPRLQLERIKHTLNIPTLSDPAELDAYVYGFLDKSLHHYECSLTDLQTHPATHIAPLCLNLFNWLIKIAKDEMRFEDPAFLSAWEQIRNNFQNNKPIYLYIDRLLQRSQSLQKSIYALHKTRLWKMMYPLRKVDAALRAFRKRRNKKLLFSFPSSKD